MSELPAYDPYEAKSSFLKDHKEAVTALCVAVLTAVLTVASFPPYQAPAFAYVCLVPGIFWAYLNPPLKVFALTMGLAQAVAWTVILGWLHHVSWFGLFLLGPFVGVWVGLWYVAAWWVMPRMLGKATPVRLVGLLGLAGAWVVVEWTRYWLLSGFPWLPLAASQWERPSILQVASFTGSGGVSFVLVSANIGFAAYAHRLFREGESGLKKRSQEFFLALFLLLACLCIHIRETFGRNRTTLPLGHIALVQPAIPQEVKWNPARGADIARVLQDTTLAAAASRPDLIVWPESTTPWAVRGDDRMKLFVGSLAAKARAPMLLGSDSIENLGKPDERWYNAAFVMTAAGELTLPGYAKRKLVPFGEYIPFRALLGWITKFVPIGGDFTPGASDAPLVVTLRQGAVGFGVLICYEDVYSDLAVASVKSGADVLAVLSNDAWFGTTGGEAYQHAASSVLRAVETRRPVIRCGNEGWSGWIDEFGGIRGVVAHDDGGIYFRGAATFPVTCDARWVGRHSFYVDHGDWFVGVSACLAAFAALLVGLGGIVPQAADTSANAGE